MAVDIKILVFWDVTSRSLLSFLVHILAPTYPTRQQLLDNLKEKRRYWNCIGEALDRDRLCGLVVRVSGYRYRGPGFDSRRYQIF